MDSVTHAVIHIAHPTQNQCGQCFHTPMNQDLLFCAKESAERFLSAHTCCVTVTKETVVDNDFQRVQEDVSL